MEVLFGTDPLVGGFYGRVVGTVKRCLKKIIGKAKLNHDELNTVMIEVESVLNSRPITYLYEELETEPLTSSHLLYGRRLTTLPVKRNLDNCNINVNFPSDIATWFPSCHTFGTGGTINIL